MALDLDLLHFEIGDRGQQLRVPVDQPLVLVDQALAIELDEHLEDGARQALVHGEALARPVAGGAEPLELVDDGAAALGLPRPDPLEEFLAAHLAAAGSWRSINCRSTTICVAMPAWSVPGCHSTSLPRMRSKRHRMSCSVLFSAWPMCSEPVTFGGGITMVKGLASRRSGRPALNAPASSQTAEMRPSISVGW